jgi:CheY-like chemotaxis protein
LEHLLRILIVEDDPLLALDLQHIVESGGHTVVDVCGSNSQARRCQSECLDFALLDIDLLDGKSYEVAQRLDHDQVPYAFVSASSPGDLPPGFRGAGFIPKPYEQATILRSIGAAAARV